ncbi:glutaminyl-peptide cyclotransferase isoform X3 [Neltuma alba]|uniref:glutaminyl-peptide cyclotransferase isoform X3 n=1 Tax=Neltuma alba TaxID=207710 RepID=UPI0010A34247|nr:glutaminyl-peptide cyclotransferase-like isoform X3 [Prosopis alba]
MGARSLKRRPIKQHNLEPQTSMASSRRKIVSHRKISVLLLASLTIAVIGLYVIWPNSWHNFESGLSYEMVSVVNEFPHDSDAFTQGLLYAENDTLFESTGLYGKSSVRKVTLHTGQVEVLQKMDDSLFGEGLTLIGKRLYQVTWLQTTGFIYDRDNLSKLQQFIHEMKDGWGLATDGKVLYGSDGSSTLYHIDPHTFKVISKQVVHFKGHQVHNLNELEFINGEIWANVYMTDCIAKISPKDGSVLGWILLPNLRQELIAAGNNGIDVLNGIAWDSEQKRVFVTGKLWPKLYEVKLLPVKRSFEEGVIEQLCMRKPFREANECVNWLAKAAHGLERLVEVDNHSSQSALLLFAIVSPKPPPPKKKNKRKKPFIRGKKIVMVL